MQLTNDIYYHQMGGPKNNYIPFDAVGQDIFICVPIGGLISAHLIQSSTYICYYSMQFAEIYPYCIAWDWLIIFISILIGWADVGPSNLICQIYILFGAHQQ